MSIDMLNTTNHDRDNANLRYVYPVISRRAGGVSVGINLNPNNACNWRCIYCQVPELKRGTAPPIDLVALEKELRFFLEELLHGEFMQTRVPQEMRRINDIALSGNGEPTSAAEFYKVTEIIARVRSDMHLQNDLKTVLITNGSLMFRSMVQLGVRNLAQLHGEVWFKLDSGNSTGMQRINDTQTSMDKVRSNLIAAIANCPTWIQTCWFALDGKPPSQQDENDYLEFVGSLLKEGHKPQGVLLYSLARPSLQVEAPRLSALPEAHLQAFAKRIETLGLPVQVSP
jgi:wyosine [tRNA(Phe)-imidazoG37] synthetase (radical SAM superfamily)